MAKLTLSDVANLHQDTTATTTINGNHTLLEAALENTLSRDGTSPNSMGAQLDMNSNQIINLPTPTAASNAATKAYVDNLAFGDLEPLDSLSALGIGGVTSTSVNYTVPTTESFPLVNITGSSAGTITFDAPTGYPERFQCKVTNNSTRGWKIAVSGRTFIINGVSSSDFTLYPTQVCVISRTGSTWSVENNYRWQTLSPLTLYVNHATGSDSNDGLTTGSALATIQKAIYVFEERIDCMQNAPTIQVADGTFTEENVVATKRLVGFHVIYLQGNTTTPSNCVWQSAAAGNIHLQARDYSGLIVSGFKFQASTSGNTALKATQFGIIDIGNVEFGLLAGGNHMLVNQDGSMGLSTNADVVVSGNAQRHLWLDGGRFIAELGASGSYTVNGGLTIGVWIQNEGGDYNQSGFTFAGAGAGAGTTGAKQVVTIGSKHTLNSIVLPGNADGYYQLRYDLASDSGGVAGSISFTGVHDTGTARSTGVGTILFDDASNRNSSGFLKVYIGSTAYYIPLFSAI